MTDDARFVDDLPEHLAALASQLRREATALSESYPEASAPPRHRSRETRAHARWMKHLSGWGVAAAICGGLAYLQFRQVDELPGEALPGVHAPSLVSQAHSAGTQTGVHSPKIELVPAGLREFSGAEREAVLDLLEHEQAEADLSI